MNLLYKGVEHSDFVAPLKQLGTDRSTNESGTAGDQHSLAQAQPSVRPTATTKHAGSFGCLMKDHLVCSGT
jgi:hypothetical protein